jgi:hypothetical protein
VTPLPSAIAGTESGQFGPRLFRGACATIIAVGLGLLLVGTGWAIADFDDRRRHVPGHLLYRSLIVLPGLLQVAYLVPLYRWSRRKRDTAFASGLILGGAIVTAVNAALLMLVLTMSRGD